MNNKFILHLLAFCIILFASFNTLFADEIALIVNADNEIDEVSISDLKKIFKAERHFWGKDEKIKLIMRPIDSIETKVLLEEIYEFKPYELERFWLKQIYNVKIEEPPPTIRSASIVNALVGQLQGAIAPIEVGHVSELPMIKILKIDGKMPGEDGYPLKTKE